MTEKDLGVDQEGSTASSRAPHTEGHAAPNDAEARRGTITTDSYAESRCFIPGDGRTIRRMRTPSTASPKAKRGRVKCEHCEGRGYFVTGAGLAALQDKYPEIPMREIQNRGWLGFPDEDDGDACDAAWLAFWGVASHEELQRKQAERREFPWNARIA